MRRRNGPGRRTRRRCTWGTRRRSRGRPACCRRCTCRWARTCTARSWRTRSRPCTCRGVAGSGRRFGQGASKERDGQDHLRSVFTWARSHKQALTSRTPGAPPPPSGPHRCQISSTTSRLPARLQEFSAQLLCLPCASVCCRGRRRGSGRRFCGGALAQKGLLARKKLDTPASRPHSTCKFKRECDLIQISHHGNTDRAGLPRRVPAQPQEALRKAEN